MYRSLFPCGFNVLMYLFPHTYPLTYRLSSRNICFKKIIVLGYALVRFPVYYEHIYILSGPKTGICEQFKHKEYYIFYIVLLRTFFIL